jgi:predicted signal transduction protein with EAL and GGDEF domain
MGSDLETGNKTTFAARHRFLISEFTWLLLGDAFADGHVLMEMTGATCIFCMVHAEGYKLDEV